jgi:hypothetical protein
VSFLSRIAMRAGIADGGAAEPLLVLKDRGLQRSPHISRQEAPPEEEELQTVRRQLDTEGDDEEVQTLRRQVVGEGEGASPAPIPAPTSEEHDAEVGPTSTSVGGKAGAESASPARHLARMPEGGDELHTIRRLAGDPEQEDAQPVRRIEEDEEDAQARPLLRSAVIRRSVQDAPARGLTELGSATSPDPETGAGAPEPLDPPGPGEAPPMLSPAPPVPVSSGERPERSSWAADAPMAALPPQLLAEVHAELPGAHFERPQVERPQVVIDRIDVLIHEATAPSRSPDRAKKRSRSFRARYLGRL